MVSTTISVPEQTWKAVKNLATDRRVSAQSIWIQAMAEFLERQNSASNAA